MIYNLTLFLLRTITEIKEIKDIIKIKKPGANLDPIRCPLRAARRGAVPPKRAFARL